jgi:hypothetical protein
MNRRARMTGKRAVTAFELPNTLSGRWGPGRAEGGGGANSPWWGAKLIPDKISGQHTEQNNNLNNRTIFCSL